MNIIKPAFYILILGAMALAPALLAQSNPAVTVHSYAGLTISGTLGDSYTVQCSSGLQETNWETLANVVLLTNPYLWMDTSAPESATRFYRVIPSQATNATAPAGMAVVPAGSFVMGDNLDGEADAPTNLEFVSAFYMDANLVTYSLWLTVYDWAIKHGYSFDNGGSGRGTNYPVQSIDWYDALKWCNARSQLAGVTPAYYTDAELTRVYTNSDIAPFVNWSVAGYRLPTETEWEKAARGGLSGNRFPFGNIISENDANYYGDPANYSYDLGPAGNDPAFGNGLGIDTSPENYFAPNGYGLHDMAGNLSEWCWDWYGTYPAGLEMNYHGSTGGSFRVLRSGSWLVNAYSCRVANRNYYYPDLEDDTYGFRSVVSVTGQ